MCNCLPVCADGLIRKILECALMTSNDAPITTMDGMLIALLIRRPMSP